MKRLIIAVSMLSLFGLGCGKSACEELDDIAVECGRPAGSSGELELCEAFDNGQLDDCITCLDGAADQCTASEDGGECDDACTISL